MALSQKLYYIHNKYEEGIVYMHIIIIIYLTMSKKLFRWVLQEIPNRMLKKIGKSIPYTLQKWLASNHPNEEIRNLFFRLTGIVIGTDTFINPNVIIIDDRYATGVKIKIGNRVAIAPGVIIISSSAPNNSTLKNNDYVKKNLIQTEDIIIDDDVWIGAGAIIMPGIKIGKESIVGAGAVITENVPDRSIVAGIPARIIKKL
jgi:maltose O-acetyltransferase